MKNVCLLGILLGAFLLMGSATASTTTVNAEIDKVVDISTTDNSISWQLTPGPASGGETINQKTCPNVGVTANCNWQLTAQDASTVNPGYLKASDGTVIGDTTAHLGWVSIQNSPSGQIDLSEITAPALVKSGGPILNDLYGAQLQVGVKFTDDASKDYQMVITFTATPVE